MNVMSRVLPFALLAVVLTAVGFAVAWSVTAASHLPDGPVDVVWDKSACAACGMHVGEPSFAAQLTTREGRTNAFDDPGCLFLWVAEHEPDVHSIWFHALHGDGWIAVDRVAFVEASPTPMGFGLGAVEVGTPGAMSLGAARERCLERLTGGGAKR